jgi:competence protein ComEA
MSSVPTKRLLVYVALGVVVLIVGIATLASMRSGAEGAGSVTFGTDIAMSSTSDASSAALTTTSTANTIFVQVAGAVRAPGVYEMPPGSRVFEAIEEAGGFSETADQQSMSLAAVLGDGCRVYVPRQGEVTADSPAVTQAGTGAGSGDASAGLVSINSATIEELDALPGIGPSLAQNIVDYRESNGPFTSVDQLGDVTGIGPSKLEKLRPLVGL